jgi:hypothetical protein
VVEGTLTVGSEDKNISGSFYHAFLALAQGITFSPSRPLSSVGERVRLCSPAP